MQLRSLLVSVGLLLGCSGSPHDIEKNQNATKGKEKPATAVTATASSDDVSTAAATANEDEKPDGKKVAAKGDGEKPTETDEVSVHYTGKLLDGRVFDSSHRRGQPSEFGVGQVIPGWQQALQLMAVGSKWEIWIPSDLAYGPRGAGAMIGPNATLHFEVELLAIME